MRLCNQCGQETNNPAFCSRSCSAKYNNHKFPKRKNKDLATINCVECKALFKMTRASQKYCTNNCKFIHIQKTRDEQIIQNKGFSENATNLTIRQFLIRQHGNYCMICGLDANDWQCKKLTLIVDHVNGDCKNQKLDNLRIVCPNCDSQLDTYKAKNKGRSTRGYHIVQK